MTDLLQKTSSEDTGPAKIAAARENERFAKHICAYFMRRFAYRTFRVLGELTAIVLGAAFVWFYALNVLLSQKTMDISFLKPNASLWFSEAFDGKSADIDHLQLAWRPGQNAIVVDARGIVVRGTSKMPLQSIDALTVALNFDDALIGKVTPARIVVSGGSVTWMRNDVGDVVAGLGTPETVGIFGVMPSAPMKSEGDAERPSFSMGPLKAVSIENARVFVRDEVNGIDLQFLETDLYIAQNEGRFSVNGLAKLAGDEMSGEIDVHATFSADYEDFQLSVAGGGINPAHLAPKRGLAARMSEFDVPMDIDLEIVSKRNIGLESVLLSITSEGGRGYFGPQTNDIEELALQASYDPAKGILNIDTFVLDGSRFGGRGSASLANIGRPATGFFKEPFSFKTELSDATLDFTGFFDEPFDLDSIKFEGSFDRSKRELMFESIELGFETFLLNAKVTASLDNQGELRVLSGSGGVNGDMTAADLLFVWPTEFATGARRWIRRAIVEGIISDLKLDFSLPDRVFSGQALSNEDLTLAFNVREGHVKYISTMTPYTNVTGRGLLRGNGLEFEAFSGNIGPLAVQRGRVDIPRLFPKGGDLIIDVDAFGSVPDMLNLIDQKPFGFTSQYGLISDRFAGSGNVNLTIRRPLLEYFDQSRIQYAVTGTFDDVKAPFSLGPHQLENGTFNLTANKTEISVSGPVNVGPWRTSLEWKEALGRDDIPTKYRLEGKMSGDTLDGFGLEYREYFGGSANVEISAEGQGLQISQSIVDVDFTNSDIRFGEYWSKAAGVNGRLSAQLSRQEDGALSARNISIEAPGLTVQGQAAFAGDAKLLNFELSNAKIEAFMDGSVSVKPNSKGTAFDVAVAGDFLDISPMVDQAITVRSSGVAIPMHLNGTLKRLALDDMFVLQNAEIDIQHNGIGTSAAKITGSTAQGDFSAVLAPLSDNQRDLSIVIPDASLAAMSFLNIQSIRDGRLTMTAKLPEVGAEGPINGDIFIDEFALVQAPIMAQILSLASLKGLTDAMSGEGLTFTRFEAPFSYENGTWSIREARASGPALGLTGNGNISFSDKTVDLDGVLVPAYSANSALSSIPVIGNIFVGKKGEGIFALNYSVKGPFSATQVSVNPLSALTPGFLRRIFETQREALPNNQGLQDEIEADNANTNMDAIPNPDGPR